MSKKCEYCLGAGKVANADWEDLLNHYLAAPDDVIPEDKDIEDFIKEMYPEIPQFLECQHCTENEKKGD